MDILTALDIQEIEDQATVGLELDDHAEFDRRVEMLKSKRRNEKWANLLAPDLIEGNG